MVRLGKLLDGVEDIKSILVYTVELLRLHLDQVGSPWHGAIETVCRTLPGMKDKDYEAVQRLAAEGPADEQVGLSPYTMPEMAQTPGGA